MIALRRFGYHMRRHVLRIIHGHCARVSAGMNCSGWRLHDGPHTFTSREWRRTRGLLFAHDFDCTHNPRRCVEQERGNARADD